jgi:hypothetical protein
MEHRGSRSFWEEHKRIPVGLTRRSFIQRVSLTTLGVCAAVTGSSRVAAYAAVGTHRTSAEKPNRCMQSCALLECKGCACGGDLYECSGCGKTFKKCFKGQKCVSSFCAQPVC